MFVNKMPRYEILSEDAMETLDRGWRRIVSELGVEFLLAESLEEFRKAGQKVEGNNVKLDPEFILEQVAKAPREFDIQARNPANTVHIGGDHMVFASVYGPPFVREGDVRRDATMADFQNFVKLSQSFPQLDSPGGTIVEPNDTPLDSRHLDMVYALQTLSDKPYMGSVTSGPNAVDTIAMGEILFGGREAIERDAGVDLADQRQLAAALRRPHARRDARVLTRDQAVIVTPFLLMGAMSPVSIPATLVQQIAEALAGHRADAADPPGLPGGLRLVPVEHRHAVGLAVVRHARVGHRPAVHRADRAPLRAAVARRRRAERLEPDSRRPGRLRGADDDAADVPGRHELRHALGRLARGRAGVLLREVHHRHRDAADAPARVHAARDRRGEPRVRRPRGGRAGGHFLGAVHTLERFRECFYRPLLSSTENFDRWTRNGGARRRGAGRGDLARDAGGVRAAAAGRGGRAELQEYVVRRRRSWGTRGFVRALAGASGAMRRPSRCSCRRKLRRRGERARRRWREARGVGAFLLTAAGSPRSGNRERSRVAPRARAVDSGPATVRRLRDDRGHATRLAATRSRWRRCQSAAVAVGADATVVGMGSSFPRRGWPGMGAHPCPTPAVPYTGGGVSRTRRRWWTAVARVSRR